MKKQYELKSYNPIKEAIVISIIYGAVGTFWIAFTDRILSSFIKDYYSYQHIQTLKGWLYVFITMVILLVLIVRKLTLYKQTLITLDYSYHTLSLIEQELKDHIIQLEQKQQELTISQQRYELALDGVNDAVWEWDFLNKRYYLSPKWKARILGNHKVETFYEWTNYIHPEDKDRYVNFLLESIKKKKEFYNYIFRVICFDQSILWIYSNGKAIYDKNGQAIRMAGSHTDITNQVKLKEEYKRNYFLVDKITHHASNLIVIWDQTGHIKEINPYVSKILGYEQDDLYNKNWFDTFLPQLSIDERQEMISQIKLEKMNQSNAHLLSNDQKDVYVLWTSNLFYQVTQDEFDIISIGTDITSLKIIKDELNYLSYYDELTNLPNRNFFEKHVTEVIKRNNNFALLCIDIDNFKHINDTLGHFAGDQLLKDISQVLNHYFKAPHFISRLSGDEFLIILNDYNNPDQILQYLNCMMKENTKPWVYNNMEYYITVTIGIALYPEHGLDKQTLLKNADIAMHHAKELGKNNYYIYDKKMNDKNALYIKTINELKKAIDLDEFILYYQPLIDLRLNKIIGVEALVRWNHYKRGVVFPGEFIEIAEKTGYIDQIDQLVFEKACKQKYYWDQLGFKDLKLSINISNKRFKNKNLYDEIVNAIHKYQIDPSSLQLEITETVLMEDLNQGIYVLEQLKELGLSIALDDFGKGFSSLNYLIKLPIDHVKLDQVFMQNIHKHENQIIVQSIIQLLHAINKKVTVEGIETMEQLEILKHYNCDIAQGYYYDKPLEPKVIEKRLNSELIKVVQ